MKKLAILILTLMMGFVGNALFSAKTHALYIDDFGTTWYDIPEVLEYKKELEAQELAACGDDMDCRRLFVPIVDDEAKYKAVLQITSVSSLVTSINPKQETIKLLIWNEDFRQRRFGHNPRYGVEVKRLYLGWFEEKDLDDKITTQFLSPLTPLFNNELPGVHMMFSYRSGIDDPSLLSVKDQEVEFKMTPGSDILNNTRGDFIYKISTNFSVSTTNSEYRRCIFSKNYREGMECRLRVSPQNYDFFPVGEPSVVPPNDPAVDEPIGGDTDLDDDDDTTDESDGNDTGATDPTENPDTDNDTRPDDVSPIKSENILPKSPNTGTATKLCKETTIEFPWWLVGLIAFGDAVVLWLFWPNKLKKSLKKS